MTIKFHTMYLLTLNKNRLEYLKYTRTYIFSNYKMRHNDRGLCKSFFVVIIGYFKQIFRRINNK